MLDRIPGAKSGHGGGNRLHPWLGYAARGGLTLALLSIVCWLGFSGARMYAAERHMSVVRIAIKDAPALALIENIKAYDLFPFPIAIRRQMSGSFLATVATGRAVVQPVAAEIVFGLAASISPLDTGGLVAKAAYYLNYGRQTELGPLVKILRKIAPWSVETWTIATYERMVAGDKAGARKALDRMNGISRTDARITYALEMALRRLK